MGLVQWDSRLETGNAMIDGQQKNLVEALNNLHSFMLKGEGRTAVDSTMKFLVEYARSHFALEEEMMYSHAYPDLSFHMKLHSDLIDGFIKLIANFEQESTALTIAVMVYLEEWVTGHFMAEDAKFINFTQKYNQNS